MRTTDTPYDQRATSENEDADMHDPMMTHDDPIVRPDPATADEEDVTFAFLCACPEPTWGDVLEWGRRYPAHRIAIAEFGLTVLEVSIELASDRGDREALRRIRERPEKRYH